VKPVKTYIGIGSNLADPVQQVRDAIKQLGHLRKSELLAHSSLYQSEPMSDIKQEDYINAVACLSTQLKPMELLLELQAIEHAFYRDRSNEHKWGPRTLDLDIILYGNQTQDDTHLTLPHPEMHKRLFVLKPLREISDDIYITGLGSLDYLILQAPAMRIKKLETINP
jgi:2-amino-4-hydroxy-6-hydroxymethyldihydropteridine diphosphokinase